MLVSFFTDLTGGGVFLLSLAAAIFDLRAHPVSSLANLRDSVLFRYSEAHNICSSGVNNYRIITQFISTEINNCSDIKCTRHNYHDQFAVTVSLLLVECCCIITRDVVNNYPYTLTTTDTIQ